MNYPIKATFIDEISYDIPSSNWTDEEWAKDLDNMKEVGIDTLVFIRGWFNGRCIYPSKVFPTMKEENEDFLGFILREAEKRQMRVFIGLYITNLTWGDGNYIVEIDKNKLFIKEVLERYGKISSFAGWYIPHETGGNSHNIKYVMDGLCSLCKELSPEKEIFVSPFFRAKGTSAVVYSPERTYEEWNNIFADCGKYIDYCAIQDGSANPYELGDYLKEMKRVCDKYDIELWSNVETFERDPRTLYFPIPFELMRKKIEVATPYVTNMITFEFSHFLSPQSIFPSARNLNRLYKNYYGNKK